MKYALLCALVCLLAFEVTVVSQSPRTTRRSTRPNRTTISQPDPGSIQKSSTALPIRRVILYSNGVAYVERRGVVTNHAEIQLVLQAITG